MNEYIFYTNEGNTEAPNTNFTVENCQVLGRAKGSSAEKALENLLEENHWISEAKFSPAKFFIKQILTEEQRTDIRTLIDYLWADKVKYYEDKDNLIFKAIKRLKNI